MLLLVPAERAVSRQRGQSWLGTSGLGSPDGPVSSDGLVLVQIELVLVKIELVFEQGVKFTGLSSVCGSNRQVGARVLATWQVVEAFPRKLGISVQRLRWVILRAGLDISAVT